MKLTAELISSVAKTVKAAAETSDPATGAVGGEVFAVSAV